MKNLELASPSEMSACARAGEITTIVAAAITRSLVSDSPRNGEVTLGFVPDQRVHTTPYQKEKL